MLFFSLFVSFVHQSTANEKANEKAKKVQTQMISLWSQVLSLVLLLLSCFPDEFQLCFQMFPLCPNHLSDWPEGVPQSLPCLPTPISNLFLDFNKNITEVKEMWVGELDWSMDQPDTSISLVWQVLFNLICGLPGPDLQAMFLEHRQN